MKKKIEKQKQKVEVKIEPKELSKHSFQSIKTRVMEKFFPKNVLLVEFNYYNGTVAHFTIKTSLHKFKHGSCVYLIDEERKLWNSNAKMFMLRYHEGFCLPFEVEVSASRMVSKGADVAPDISTSFNPNVLKEVLKMEYAKGVIQGAEVHQFLKNSFTLIIIILILTAAHLALNAFMSGWI